MDVVSRVHVRVQVCQNGVGTSEQNEADSPDHVSRSRSTGGGNSGALAFYPTGVWGDQAPRLPGSPCLPGPAPPRPGPQACRVALGLGCIDACAAGAWCVGRRPGSAQVTLPLMEESHLPSGPVVPMGAPQRTSRTAPGRKSGGHGVRPRAL